MKLKPLSPPRPSKMFQAFFDGKIKLRKTKKSRNQNGRDIEGLHHAIRTYTRMILPRCLVSFGMARYREEQQKNAGLLIYFAELCHNLELWYELNKK